MVVLYAVFRTFAKNVAPAKLQPLGQHHRDPAAASYLFYPFIVNRLLMYFAIWWIGVRFAESYLKGKPSPVRSLLPHGGVLLTIIGLLGINLYIHYSYTKVYTYPLVAYPFGSCGILSSPSS